MIYDVECINGHRKEVFVQTSADKGCETEVCHCGSTMASIFSPGKGIAWFEEGRPRVIHNLGPEPITVTSYKQHREAMKKAGVVEAGATIPHGIGRASEKGRWV